MSEPIQSIAQNNYILHNIDAKKLYVQEPLFTANSGDAVYVGWRPDETVLWSGSSPTNSAVLSEPNSNFERIKIQIANEWFEITPTTGRVLLIRGKGDTNVWFSWIKLQYDTTTNAYYINNAKSFNFGNATATSWSNPSVSVNSNEDTKSISKVIGINRISGGNA